MWYMFSLLFLRYKQHHFVLQLHVSYTFNISLSWTPCLVLVLRGVNKVNLASETEAGITECNRIQERHQPVVYDVVGKLNDGDNEIQ